MYFCLNFKDAKKRKQNYSIYRPPGYKLSDIDEVVDTAKTFHKKVQALFAHKSQRRDVIKFLSIFKKLPKREHFLVLKK